MTVHVPTKRKKNKRWYRVYGTSDYQTYLLGTISSYGLAYRFAKSLESEYYELRIV